jgi:hypothetical protein
MKNNPYIGPRPFERTDRDWFFGRARETRDLLSLIMAERAVLFYAPAGAGKTSLLNTQIIPALEDEGFNVLLVTGIDGKLPADIELAALGNPFVFTTLQALARPFGAVSLEHLTLKDYLQAIDDDEHPAIVIFDQFEQIFTAPGECWQEVRGFFEQLRGALQALPRLGVVLVMREDHVVGLDPYVTLLPKRLKIRFRMEPLGYDSALDAVKKPAQNVACAYGTGVAERLVDDLRRIQSSEPACQPPASLLGLYVEPVQLQIVCRQLWDYLPERDERVITWLEIEQFGGVTRALTDLYEDAVLRTMEETDVSEQQLRHWFSTELVTPLKTRGLVLRGEHETHGLPNAAVDVLVREHLIRPEVRAGACWYELVHDRLVTPIVTSNSAWEQSHQGSTALRVAAVFSALLIGLLLVVLLFLLSKKQMSGTGSRAA